MGSYNLSMKMLNFIFITFVIFNSLYSTNFSILTPLPFKYGENFSFKVYILGQHVGFHYMSIHNFTNINDITYYIVSGQTITRPDLRYLYDMDDRDWTIFDKETLYPLYNERSIKEGKWIDHLRQVFIPEEKKCVYYHKTRNYSENTLSGENPIMDYNTLMLYFRALDYSKIDNKTLIPVSYKHRDIIYNSSFTYQRITVNYNKNKYPVIQVKENGGLGIYFTMLDDENRTPYEIRITAFHILGFRVVDLRVVIESYNKGSQEL